MLKILCLKMSISKIQQPWISTVKLTVKAGTARPKKYDIDSMDFTRIKRNKHHDRSTILFGTTPYLGGLWLADAMYKAAKIWIC